MTVAQAELPFLLCETEVARVERLSPSFIRVELAAPELAEFGSTGPSYDQRIKLLLPEGDAPLPVLTGGEGWYAEWLALPQPQRGHLRTYTVRDVVGSGVDTRVVVDLVVHGTEADSHGEAGPGSRWAAAAVVGSRVGLLGPRRSVEYGGIEFAPPYASELLLVGDETAVPAVLSILAQLDADARGTAYLEVPTQGDVQTVVHPEGVRVVWLPRDLSPRGELLRSAVLGDLGAVASPAVVDEVDPDLWETPTYSSSGEALEPVPHSVGGDRDELYAWIAGESRVVTGLRRSLVDDLGMDRRQVAFMGYWREGVSMGS